MKTRTTTLLLLCALFACTSANTVTAGKQDREVGTFRKIQASAAIDVYFTQEKSQSIRVETENVDENEVITEVKNGTLELRMKNRIGLKFDMKKQSIKVYVSAPLLEGLSMSGSADFHAENLKSAEFSISTSGSADIKIENLTVEGKTNIATSGGSDCNIKNLKTNTCRIATSGGSDIKIGMEVSGELSVAASGGSNIKLSGTAEKVSVSASGGADINIRDLQHGSINSHSSGGAKIRK